nr:unnamed protein product [Digitaria exilis]
MRGPTGDKQAMCREGERWGGEERPVGGGGVEAAAVGGEGGAGVGACDGEAPHDSEASEWDWMES